MENVFPVERQKQAVLKMQKRLLPLLAVCMLICFLDRINVGFASLEMNPDIGLSAAAYGFGAGLFFLGYFIFEIPSNLILEKLGAKAWLTRIMITWGLISAGMAFVQGPKSFYALRFLLGIAEAGFFPGIVLYCTYWFVKQERAFATSTFFFASYCGAAFGSLISGLIMKYLGGSMGLAGWRWLFIIEGLPAVFLGFFLWRYLPNRPYNAKWLSPAEKEWAAKRIEEENQELRLKEKVTIRTALTRPLTLVLGLAFLCSVTGKLGLTLWLPQIIKRMGSLSTLTTTLYAMLPFLIMMLSVLLFGRHSDQTMERRGHLTVAIGLNFAGLIIAAGAHSLGLGYAGILIVSMGAGLAPVFWATASEMMDPREAAAGIALINSVASLGGFFGPNIMGIASTLTGNYNAGLYAFASSYLLMAVLIQIAFGLAKRRKGIGRSL